MQKETSLGLGGRGEDGEGRWWVKGKGYNGYFIDTTTR